jgi:hypothetical protein
MTLQHTVLFAFSADLSAPDAAEMRQQIHSWPQAIGGINIIRFGEDITGARTKGHQYMLYTEFDDPAALQAYQKHPVHQRFLKWVMDHGCSPLAFDYDIDQDTVIWPRLSADLPKDKS